MQYEQFVSDGLEQFIGVEVDVETIWVFPGFSGSFLIDLELLYQELNHFLGPLLLVFQILEHESLGIGSRVPFLQELLDDDSVNFGIRLG